MKLDRYGEGLFAFLPVARAEFIGLQRVEHAENFEGIASYR